MSFDLFGGISELSLQQPIQPVQLQAPDATKIFLHSGQGEDPAQYQSFIKAVSDLAQAFKFLPQDDQQYYQTGTGKAYSNLDFSPDASDWNLLTGADNQGCADNYDSSILDEINSYFNWNDIKSIGSGQSYYQIAGSGAISSYSDEQAFDLMCSMTESKDRVFGVLKEIFGDPSNLTDDNAVIQKITDWLGQYTQVDPHNLGILKVFFGMQSDFIDTLDAYMNSQTYWGSNNTFSDTLMTKVGSYISTLTGDKQTAAESLESDWLAPPSRWDTVGGVSVDDLADTDGSWVKFFQDKMTEFATKEIIRSVVCNLSNLSSNQKYTKDKADYEEKKDDLIQDEIWLQRMQAKALAESKRFLQKLLGRKKSLSVSGRGRSSSVGARGRSTGAGVKAVARPSKPVIRAAARSVVGPTIRSLVGAKARSAAASSARSSSVASRSPNQAVQAKKNPRDEKKVI